VQVAAFVKNVPQHDNLAVGVVAVDKKAEKGKSRDVQT
jgi:hypothetical protein